MTPPRPTLPARRSSRPWARLLGCAVLALSAPAGPLSAQTGGGGATSDGATSDGATSGGGERKAEAPPRPAAFEALQKVAFLQGRWKGESTMDMGPRGKQTVLQTEKVEARLGGAALVIEGLGKSRPADGQPERVVHEALGIVYYDDGAKGLKILAIKADGSSVTSDFAPVEGGWRWGLKTPGGHVRYTISQPKPGEWHERGEFSADGVTWRPFMEMRLSREG